MSKASPRFSSKPPPPPPPPSPPAPLSAWLSLMQLKLRCGPKPPYFSPQSEAKACFPAAFASACKPPLSPPAPLTPWLPAAPSPSSGRRLRPAPEIAPLLLGPLRRGAALPACAQDPPPLSASQAALPANYFPRMLYYRGASASRFLSESLIWAEIFISQP